MGSEDPDRYCWDCSNELTSEDDDPNYCEDCMKDAPGQEMDNV